jgi:tRNA-dihydrouridine synthase A
MDWTDAHYRQLARTLSRRAVLYTEMVVDATVLHAEDKDRHLAFPAGQRPLVFQVGGSDPAKLAAAAAIAASYGYDEINLNCGCPSSRVAGAGCFGAKLMLDPPRVAAAVAAMAAAAPGIPITVKCRLGVDDVDSYEELTAFVGAVAAAGVSHIVVHARKCLLDGLSPAQNRTVPPLRHGWVYALARDFPWVGFTLNGGVGDLATAAAALAAAPAAAAAPAHATPLIAGVMIGRAAYHDPWRTLAGADVGLWGDAAPAVGSRREALAAYASYAATVQRPADGGKLRPPTRALVAPLLGLFHSEPGGRRWRAAVDAALKQPGATVASVLDATLGALDGGVLDAAPAPWRGADPAWSPGDVPPPAGAGAVEE